MCRPIGALLPGDLGPLNDALIFDPERAAHARDDVIRLVEAERREVPERVEPPIVCACNTRSSDRCSPVSFSVALGQSQLFKASALPSCP